MGTNFKVTSKVLKCELSLFLDNRKTVNKLSNSDYLIYTGNDVIPDFFLKANTCTCVKNGPPNSLKALHA